MFEARREIDVIGAPSTRYQGSKRKLLPWISGCLKELQFTSAADLFGGTGAVSYLLKRMGKSVLYNDALRFNYVIGSALVQNDDITLTASEIAALTAPTRGLDGGGTIAKYFRGIFFTDFENRWLDYTIREIDARFDRRGVPAAKRQLAMYALFQTCLSKRPFNLFHRHNLHLRTAAVHRTFGNKTTWDKPIRLAFRAFLHEANAAVFRGVRPCCAFNLDVMDVPAEKYDLIYIDPPYLLKEAKNETADYRRVYHFLEGIAEYNSWPQLIDLETRNRRLKVLEPNGWLDKRRNSKLLNQLFDKFESSIIVVSYKRHGIPSVDTIVQNLKRRGRKVRCFTTRYRYALNHQNGEAQRNRECLVIAE